MIVDKLFNVNLIVMKKKILIICPIVPFPENGAEQSDRANGIRQLVRLGFEVRVIAKRRNYQKEIDIKNFSKAVGGISVKTVSYKYSLSEKSFFEKIVLILKRITSIKYYDGAAFEYFDSEIQTIVENEVKDWKPDLLWFEYTYLWPLFHIANENNIPIITRSINFEPKHFLDEDGRSLLNAVRAIPKYMSEYRVVKDSQVIFSITPDENAIYLGLGGKNVVTLPLRGLHVMNQHVVRENFLTSKEPINLYFMGSIYNVSHNKQAAKFIITQLAPEIFKQFGNEFIINIIGAKLPDDLIFSAPSNVRYHGFVQDLDLFLGNMDIAIVPSLYGAGMQQKIFEPLMRGFPTIVSSRGLAGYNFGDGNDVLIADSTDQYVDKLKYLKSNPSELLRIGERARSKSLELFSVNVIDRTVMETLKDVLV